MLAKQCAKLASDKKAINPIILIVKDLTDVTDYFVICSGTSSTQIKAIADNIVDKMADKGLKPAHFDSDTEETWIVVDYRDVIVHIFNDDTRAHYRLEQLWGDAKMLEYEKLREKNKKKSGATD